MHRIAIIGNSAAGFSCCQSLLKSQQPCELTVITNEDTLPYNKNLLIGYLAGSVAKEELFLCGPDFYEKNKINFLKNAKAARVDTKKQLVALKDNSKINYDYLVIASGCKIDISDIPGNTKDGVFTACSLEDISKIKERLMIADTIAIVGEAGPALKLCAALEKKGKHVKVISSVRPDNFTPEEETEWIDGSGLAEIIGEGSELKALKLTNGKAVGTSLILFTGNYKPQAEFLKETEVRTKDGYIIVDTGMRTNIENIFACGSVCRSDSSGGKEKTWEEAAGEGVLAADNLILQLERGKTTCQTY